MGDQNLENFIWNTPISDTYVDINENMLLDINLYNSLIPKAKS